MQKPTFKEKIILASSCLLFGILLISLYTQNPGLLSGSGKDSSTNNTLKGGLQIIASPSQNTSKPVLNFKTPARKTDTVPNIPKAPLTIRVKAICGNGIIESSEQCDDGNKTNEDGCSSKCENEALNEPVCGNGIVEVGEACDGDQNCTETCELSQIETVEMPLEDYFNSVFNHIIEKDSNQYSPPTNTEKQDFKAALEMFMNNKEVGAQAFEPLGYKVTRLIDTSDQNTVHYVIEESGLDNQGNFELGWGTLFLRENKNGLQVANLHLSVPHPKFDTHTPLFGLRIYQLSGETLYMAGAHRNANNATSLLQPEYKISDQSHNNAILTVIGEVLANSINDVFVEFHGHETANYPALLQGGYNAVLSMGSASQTSPLQIATVNLMNENGFNGPAGCGIQLNNVLCGTNNTLKEIIKNNQPQSDFLHVELGTAPRSNLNKEESANMVSESIVEAIEQNQ